jgi:predicted NBD/HSP70 family sugar kinase
MGDSVGGAIYSNGSILEGDHGYAAEFGLMKTFDEKGNLTTIESLCSMKSLYHRLNVNDVIELIELSHKHDLALSSALDQLGQHLAQLMHNFYQIFDFEQLCIVGEVEAIRDFFLPLINNQLNLYDLENREMKIDLERDIEPLMIIGAKDLLQSHAFQTLIDKRKDKIANDNNF